MTHFKTFLLTLVAAHLAGFAIFAQAPGTPAPLGLNLSGVTDYASEIVFVDAFKAARAWISQAKGQPWGKGGPLDVDADGVVRSLRDGQFAETVVFTGFEKRFPAGVFTCFYDGDGAIDFTGDARVVSRDGKVLKVEIQPKSGQTFARITRTNPKDPVRNIRLIMPGFENSYEKQPFHPDFLQRWRGFKSFRFMDWARTNNSKLSEWTDRPTLTTQSQAMKGVALEYMIELSNQLDVDPWFCLPHLATDDYAAQFARLVKARLKPSLKVYLEYSNECWNGQFEQARYCKEQGQKLGLSDNPFAAQLAFYSQRAVALFAIFAREFGDDKRLIRVLAAQSANPWTGTTVLDWKDASKHADAIAIAPYFGNSWGSPKTAEKVAEMNVDDIIKALPKDVAAARKNMQTYAAEARKRGLRLLAYEAGQHLVGHGGAENNDRLTKLLIAVNRHPAMKQLYSEYLDSWNEAGGDLCCIFSSMSLPSKWGSWGLLEHTSQDRTTAPKYLAVQAYLQR